MRVHVGTSGYSFPEWKGAFYPKTLPAGDMLGYYAERFPTVEINNTFYRMPRENVVVEWAAAVPEGFTFSIKASQRITHHARLKDVESMMEHLLRVCTALGDKRGPTLFQLPPNMKHDLERLAGFLSLIPRRWKSAIEFRHATWFADDVYSLLREHEVALVTAESEDSEPALAVTAPYGYLRLHKPAYTTTELDAWAAHVNRQQWEEAWVYFKHDTDTAGPELAAAFATRFG
jgi:uncharacterized protein YecE (DUF72 family)